MTRRDGTVAAAGRAAKRSARRGATFGDMLLLTATLAVVASMAYPGMRARAYERHLERVVAEVEMLLDAAERVRADTGTWPAAAPAGWITPEVPGTAGEESPAAFRLEWHRLVIADVPAPLSGPEAEAPGDLDDEDAIPPPPEPSLHHLGLVFVHAADDAVFDALLSRFGMARSFVHDTTWTLVLPRMPAPAL